MFLPVEMSSDSAVAHSLSSAGWLAVQDHLNEHVVLNKGNFFIGPQVPREDNGFFFINFF